MHDIGLLQYYPQYNKVKSEIENNNQKATDEKQGQEEPVQKDISKDSTNDPKNVSRDTARLSRQKANNKKIINAFKKADLPIDNLIVKKQDKNGKQYIASSKQLSAVRKELFGEDVSPEKQPDVEYKGITIEHFPLTWTLNGETWDEDGWVIKSPYYIQSSSDKPKTFMPLYCENEKGEVINFPKLEDAKQYIDDYIVTKKGKIKIKHGDEVHFELETSDDAVVDEKLESEPVNEGKYQLTFTNGPGSNDKSVVIVDAKDSKDAMNQAYRMPQTTSRRYSNVWVQEYNDGVKSFGCVLNTELIWNGKPDGRNKGEIIVFVNANDKPDVVRWARRNTVGKYIHTYEFIQTPFTDNKGKQWFFDEPVKEGQDWRVTGIKEVYYVGSEDPNYLTVS